MVLHGAAWCCMTCQAGPEASQAKAQKEWGHRGADDVEGRDSSSSPMKLRPWRRDLGVLYSSVSSHLSTVIPVFMVLFLVGILQGKAQSQPDQRCDSNAPSVVRQELQPEKNEKVLETPRVLGESGAIEMRSFRDPKSAFLVQFIRATAIYPC